MSSLSRKENDFPSARRHRGQKREDWVISQARTFGSVNRGLRFWCFHWAHHRYTNDPSKDRPACGHCFISPSFRAPGP
eukprot:46898-Amphidinium_carterae.2